METNKIYTKVLALFLLIVSLKAQGQTASIAASASTISPGTSVTFTPSYTDPPIGLDIVWYVNGTAVYDDATNSVALTTPYTYFPTNGDVVYFSMSYPNPVNGTPDSTNSASVTITVNTLWTGTASTSFSDISNWTSAGASTVCVIPSGASNQPLLNANATVGDIQIDGTLALNGHTLTINGAVSGGGTLSCSPTSSLTIGGTAGTINFTTSSDTLKNLTLNSSASATLGNQLNIVAGTSLGTVTVGSGATLTTGGHLALLSDANGTARIGESVGTISNNVTVQRFITDKSARRYSFIGSAVSGVTISNSWQQQIYITGTGTGGTVCGTPNSNGFDATQNNASSMSTYNATPVNGRHYVGVPNTNATNLSPGTGYVVNIRGNRNSGTVTCADQLETVSPAPPEAVTLSATGTVTSGDLSVAVNDPAVHSFTLLANPYPSQLSFTSFKASNSIIYDKMWTFSPFNGNYTTYSAGVIANGATGYDNTSGDNIASGQAFFVQANTTGSVLFHESHKTSATIPNTQYFGATKNKLIRVGLKSSTDNALIDEVVVRYNSYGTKEYNPTWDATSFSSSNQTLVALKGSNRLAIATHLDSSVLDTIQLGVHSSSIGEYRLVFSDFENIDSLKTITLVDNFLASKRDIRINQSYNFKITSDTASAGTNRFKIITDILTPLPIKDIVTTATAIKESEIAVKWELIGQDNIASYSVEHSVNGSVFSNLTTIKQTVQSSYSFTDADAVIGFNYYRIKVTYKDGTTDYSKVVSVQLSVNSNPLSVFPNPAKSIVTIKGSHISSIQVVDNMGRVIKTLVLKDATNPTLSVGGLPVGVCHLRVQTTDGKVSGVGMMKE